MLKIAILAEKFAEDYTWYVDTILNLIRLAGDYVSEEVWYRIIQIVINRQDVQGYAAKTCFEVCVCVCIYAYAQAYMYIACNHGMDLFLSHTHTYTHAQSLQAPACHENMVKVGGYILGEFGNLIAGDPRSRLESIKCLACSHQKGQCTCNTCRHQL